MIHIRDIVYIQQDSFLEGFKSNSVVNVVDSSAFFITRVWREEEAASQISDTPVVEKIGTDNAVADMAGTTGADSLYCGGQHADLESGKFRATLLCRQARIIVCVCKRENVMAVGSILSTGTQAIEAGIQRTNAASSQIATRGVEDENLARNLVELKLGETQVKAAANLVKAGDEMLGTIIDIRA